MKKILFIFGLFTMSLVFSQTIVLQNFASGLSNPVEIVHANDSRLFVVQQSGQIKIVQPNGSVSATNFLDVSSKIIFAGERGLLGLAFHPQYATNGYFFVYYNNTAGNITLARYTVSATNPNIADLTTEKILFSVPKPFDNHNGGSLHFAPDGKLWISTGDGGSSGDPNNNSQNTNSLLGKMLRLDVDATGPYNIPADNPFAASAGADEIWAYGLRNAWKFSFDLTAGNVMIADVGQGAIEEINRMPISAAGLNYGWRCYEGNNPYLPAGCPNSAALTFPTAVYDHSGGKCSITGGYVYRGSNYPAFYGKYIFADYCSKQIGILNTDNSITWSPVFTGSSFVTFGQDAQQELYIAAINTGIIYKVTTTSLGTSETISSEITMYPNPASDKIYVKGLNSSLGTIEIINAEGRKVLEAEVNSDKSVDISALVPGIYYVTLKSEGIKVYSQKLIVKK